MGKTDLERKALRVYHTAGVSPNIRASTQSGRFRADTTKAGRNVPCEGESLFQTEEQRTLAAARILLHIVLARVRSTEHEYISATYRVKLFFTLFRSEFLLVCLKIHKPGRQRGCKGKWKSRIARLQYLHQVIRIIVVSIE